MRITYPTGLVTAFYGRNPLYINKGYGQANITPHADTTRASYTVPTNRRALLSSVMCSLFRMVAATTVGVATIYVTSTIGGGNFWSCVAQMYTNNLGDRSIMANGGQIFLTASDTVELHTSDSSTGGQMDYRGSFTLVEFDP